MFRSREVARSAMLFAWGLGSTAVARSAPPRHRRGRLDVVVAAAATATTTLATPRRALTRSFPCAHRHPHTPLDATLPSPMLLIETATSPGRVRSTCSKHLERTATTRMLSRRFGRISVYSRDLAQCFHDAALASVVDKLVAQLAQAPTRGLAAIKQALHAAESNTLAAQLDLERDLQRVLASPTIGCPMLAGGRGSGACAPSPVRRRAASRPATARGRPRAVTAWRPRPLRTLMRFRSRPSRPIG